MLQVDWGSFFKRKVKMIDDYHGIYFVCGRQGTGKTYMAVNYAKDLGDKVKIVTNIHSLKLEHRDFDLISEITNDVEPYTGYVIHERS